MRVSWIVLTLFFLAPALFKAQAICIDSPGCQCDRQTGIRVCKPGPSSTEAGCPCATEAMRDQALASCPGTINPSCNGAPDPFSMNLGCDPGGINPPGILVLFVSDGGGERCYGVFAQFLGEGLGYETFFDTGGYIDMDADEEVVCEAFYASTEECNP